MVCSTNKLQGGKNKEGKGNLQAERDFREIIHMDLAEILIQIKQAFF